jgi:tetratricopeptide (TPR) repeat protein
VLKISAGHKPSRIDLLALERLTALVTNQGDAEQARQFAQQVRTAWTARYGPRDLSSLMLRTRVAHSLAFLGDIPAAERELRAVLAELPLADAPNAETSLLFKEWFGVAPRAEHSARSLLAAYVNETLGANVLAEFGHQYEEAEWRIREALRLFTLNLGDNHEATVLATSSLGATLTQRGKFEEAERMLTHAKTFLEAHLPARHPYVAVQSLCLARLRLEQRRLTEALQFAEEAFSACTPASCRGRVRAEFIWDLGRITAATGRLRPAIALLRESLTLYESSQGPRHLGAVRVRVELAETLMRAGHLDDASRELSQIAPDVLLQMPRHPVRADALRVRGLLALNEGKAGSAVDLLSQSRLILEAILGDGHWRTRRVAEELENARRQAPLSSST